MKQVNNNSDNNRCIFCDPNIYRNLKAKYKTVIAVRDLHPVTLGHLLILPRRHVEDYFSLTLQEKIHADKLILICKNRITTEDPSVTGFNIGINCGASAGQTIFHCHIHLIPRRDGDTHTPRGGVRGVIPDKMDYPFSK